MKKRLLCLVLALVMIMGMLPVMTFAATTETRNLKLMANTDYQLLLESVAGAPVYTKNKQVTLTDDGGNQFTGWAQEIVTVTDEATDEWNLKFFYNDSIKKWNLVLKGAKLDAYNDDTKKVVANASPIVGYGSESYGYEMYITITEDSYLEGKYMFNAYGTSTRWSSLNIDSENGATLYGKTTSYGIYSQRSVAINANIECDTMAASDVGNSFMYIKDTSATRSFKINGGTLKINAYQLFGCNDNKHALYLNSGNINLSRATKFATYKTLYIKDGLCYQFTDLNGNPTTVENLPVDGGAKFETFANHTLSSDGGDCTAGGSCAICSATMAGRDAHEMGEDDDNCVTPITCKYCTVVMVEGNSAHEANDDDNNCTTAVTCKNCSYIFVEAKEHTPKDAVIENEDDKSYESVVYCDECGNEVSRETISKLCPHTNSTFLSQVDSTCTEDGVAYYYCNDCEENYEVVIPASGHNHIAGTPVAPTILAQGYTPYICDKCGDTYNSDFQDILWAAASIGERGFDSLKEAVEAAEDGDIILLRKNIKEGEALYIDKDITINFNGGYYSVSTAYQGAAIAIAPGAEVTLWNGNPSGSSKLMIAYSTAGVLCCKNFNYLIINNGTLHVKNLTLNGNNAFGNGDTYTIENSGIVNLNEDTVVQARVSSIHNIAGTVTKAENAEVTAPKGYHFNANTGVLEAHSYVETLDVATVYDIAYLRYTCACGDFYRIPLTGSTKLPVIAINSATGKLYATVQEAVDEAENGQTIEMVDKVQNAKALVIPADLKITIDMKGFYYATKVASDGAAMVIEEGADLTLISSGTNSAVKVEYVTYWMFDSVIKSAGNLTIENVTVNGNNLFNEGSRAIVNNNTLILRGDVPIKIRQNDPRVDVFGGEGELIREEAIQIAASISSSHKASHTVSPGKAVAYTITLTNNSANAGSVIVTGSIPKAAEYVSGCDQVSGSLLTWKVPLDANETKTITYTLKVKEGETYLGQALECTAKVKDIEVSCHNIYIERTLGKEDQRIMETAIDAFRQYTCFKSFDILKMMYYVAFSKTISYSDADGNVMSPAAILSLIYTGEGSTGGSEGSGEEAGSAAVDFRSTVIPTLYGGTGVTAAQLNGLKGIQAEQVTTDDLMAGDILLVQETASDTGKVYIYNGSKLFLLGDGVVDVNTQQVLNTVTSAYRYAALRVAFVMANRNDYLEPTDENLSDAQKAVIATAEAYLLRGDRGQYDAGSTMKPSARSEYTENSPEDYTSDSWKYSNCAMLTFDSYYFGLGYHGGGNWYTGTIINTAKNQKIYYYEVTGTETEAEQKAQADLFYSTLQPGDVICIRRANDSGHALLYIGNGKIIHSTGSSYKTADTTGTVGIEAYEATFRYLNAYDIFDPKCDSGTAYTYYPFSGKVTKIGIYRPLKSFKGTVPEESLNRIENLQDIVVEKVASKAFGQSVNVGEELTYTFKLLNAGNEAKTVQITDVIPTGTSFVSANGATVENGNLAWTVTIPAGEKAEVSYTVKVGNDVPDNKIESKSAKVGGVSVRSSDLFVANTLTEAQQQAIVDAVASLSSSKLTNLELANEIYKIALGVENVFSYTELKTLHSQMYEKKEDDTKYTFIDNDLTAMAAPGLFGGRNFKCDDSGKYGHLTRLPREYNLIVGDILFGRTSSANGVYIYLGDGLCWALSSNSADTLDMNGRMERAFGYKNYWAVLRPSMIIDN